MDKRPPPTWETLLDWIEGRLTPNEAARVAAHVESTGAAAADIAWLRAFAQARSELVFDDPPPELRQALRNEFNRQRNQQPQHERSMPGFISRFIATLNFDSKMQPGLVGARAGESTEERRLVFSTESADVLLTVHGEDDILRIDGHVLPTVQIPLDAFQAQLLQGNQVVADIPLDQIGQFSFSALAPEIYRLLLISPALHIVIDSLDLQS